MRRGDCHTTQLQDFSLSSSPSLLIFYRFVSFDEKTHDKNTSSHLIILHYFNPRNIVTSMLKSSSSLMKTFLATAMLFSYLNIALRQRSSGGSVSTTVVTAFSLATAGGFTSRSASAASRSFGTTLTNAFNTNNNNHVNNKSSSTATSVIRPSPAFYRLNGGDMKLQMSTTATATVSSDLEKKMDVEHPAYEVITKDFIEEYGTATTLYRHKKSGAELLSVAADDDNKVFGITFRTPRK